MTTYAIRVAGDLDDRWAATWLGDVAMTREDDGTTTVTVSVADQAQLRGVLAGLHDIGAVLLELRAATAPAPPGAPLLERTLHTRRLALRAASADDAEATWRYRRLDTVGEWLTSSGAEHDAYCTSFVEPDRLAATVIVTLGHDAAAPIIGDFMLRRQDAWAQSEVAERARDVQAELGWVLDPAYTGNGYATEAVRELLRHCFEDLGVHRVTAGCFLENDASWRLMERVGMRREQHAVRDALHRSGRWLDSLGYAMLADEWPPE